MRAGRSIPAMLLLVAVTAGLFAMHTLGHAGKPMAMSTHEPFKSMVPMSVAPSDLGPNTVVSVSADPPAPGLPRTPIGALALCLAILGGVTLLAVVAWLAHRGRQWPPSPDGRATRIAHAVRGPPSARMGLALADLSVLRN